MRNIRLLQAVAALTALSVTATAFAQVEVKKQVIKRDGRVKERTRVYNGINQTPWYSVPVVRQQLNLTDDQYGQLNNSYNTAYTTYNTGITGLNDGLTDEQRAQQTAQLNGTFYTNWNQATNKVIVDPAARQRFNQAYWQYQHYGAFSDPTVRQQLNLTDAQIKQFQTYDRDPGAASTSPCSTSSATPSAATTAHGWTAHSSSTAPAACCCGWTCAARWPTSA